MTYRIALKTFARHVSGHTPRGTTLDRAIKKTYKGTPSKRRASWMRAVEIVASGAAW